MSKCNPNIKRGKTLRELRKAHQRTQQEIADLLNISTANYCKKEHGSLACSLDEAKILADYYGTTVDHLFF